MVGQKGEQVTQHGCHFSAPPPRPRLRVVGPRERGSSGLVRGPLGAGLVLIRKAPLQRVVAVVHISGLNSETLGRGSRKV